MESESIHLLYKSKSEMTWCDPDEHLGLSITFPVEHRFSGFNLRHCHEREANVLSKTMLHDLESGSGPRPWPKIFVMNLNGYFMKRECYFICDFKCAFVIKLINIISRHWTTNFAYILEVYNFKVIKYFSGSEGTFIARMEFWLCYIQATLYSGVHGIWGSKHNYQFVFGNAEQWMLSHQCHVDTIICYTALKRQLITHQGETRLHPCASCSSATVQQGPREGTAQPPVPGVTALLEFPGPSRLPLRKMPANGPSLQPEIITHLPIMAHSHLRPPESKSLGHPPWTLTL